MQRPVPPNTHTIELDLSDENYRYICALDADGECLGIIADLTSYTKAEALAKKLAKTHNLPLKTRDVPTPLGE